MLGDIMVWIVTILSFSLDKDDDPYKGDEESHTYPDRKANDDTIACGVI